MPTLRRAASSIDLNSSLTHDRSDTSLTTSLRDIVDFIDSEFVRETEFLAELVKVPTDNPPGDCARACRARGDCSKASASRSRPTTCRRAGRADGMISATNLIVRRRFGDGPVVALNAHGDVVPPGRGLDATIPTAPRSRMPHGTVMYGRGVAVSKSDFATYTWALLALEGGGRAGRSSAARSSCISPMTRRPAARSARTGCSSRASPSPTS